MSDEIIEGLFRPGDLVTLSGWMNVGKSPLLKDWAVAIAGGVPWCGRKTQAKPIVFIDFEARHTFFFEGIGTAGGWYAICGHHGVNPASLDVVFYMDHGAADDLNTSELHITLGQQTADKFRWLSACLEKRPTAVVMVDPLQLLFNFNKNRSQQVVAIYTAFRALQRQFREAAFVFTFNLKKRDRRVEVPPLLRNPHDWLQECAGSLDIQNRSDARLGLDTLTPDDREPVVLNGFRRGESCEPLILDPAWHEGQLAGFQRVPFTTLNLEEVLSPRMLELWNELPSRITSEDLRNASSRSTAYRLKDRAVSLGLWVETGKEIWEKKTVA